MQSPAQQSVAEFGLAAGRCQPNRQKGRCEVGVVDTAKQLVIEVEVSLGLGAVVKAQAIARVYRREQLLVLRLPGGNLFGAGRRLVSPFPQK